VNRFKRLRGGGIQATLDPTEVDLLRALYEELRNLYVTDDDEDPVYDRLFPRAYLDPTQEEAEKEWQDMVHPELLRERLESLDAIGASLDRGDQHRDKLRTELNADETQSLLGLLNDARLALGTRLQVTEDMDDVTLDPADPKTPTIAAYMWLTEVQADLLETLVG
jgi:uncharacterized protein with von Willebrand factor type A (vWA) domain